MACCRHNCAQNRHFGWVRYGTKKGRKSGWARCRTATYLFYNGSPPSRKPAATKWKRARITALQVPPLTERVTYQAYFFLVSLPSGFVDSGFACPCGAAGEIGGCSKATKADGGSLSAC